MDDESLTIQIGMTGGDHLVVHILGRPDENDDWLSCTIEVVAGGFSGQFPAMLVTVDFPRFRRDLQRLYDSLAGNAVFTTIERQLEITCDGNDRGGISIEGVVQDRAGIGNSLKFRFDIDQTFLPPLIAQLRTIEDAYPGRRFPQ